MFLVGSIIEISKPFMRDLRVRIQRGVGGGIAIEHKIMMFRLSFFGI
jgi:hypothetical protein